MTSYLRLWSFALLATLAAAFALNYWVDPYGLYRTYRDGEWKPHAATQGALIKPYQVSMVQPRTVVLGNSRAEIGFDPDDMAWPRAFRPVYNLALPGSGTRTASRLLDHVFAANSPQLVVLGVDFMDFLTAPDAQAEESAGIARLLVTPTGQPNRWRWLQMLHDGASTLLSLDAVVHSLNTLRLRGKADVAHLTFAGFNPSNDYRQIARQEGYFNLFRQRDTENLRAYQRRHKNLFLRNSRSSPAFDDVATILRTAGSQQVPVIVLIYPYHGHLLEILRTTGFWPLFEEWKRTLTDLVATEGRGNAVLWDFSGYHAFARERVPQHNDRTAEVRWYWEAGHFKSSLGHEVLMRIFGDGMPAFGVMLTPDSIERHLLDVRIAGEGYRAENPGFLSELDALAN
ncbi:MAG: hypothetical protein JNK06_03895 [Candidatus Accumulibacter phosphatis]|uniref:hypothetical protein n=1 Tax=Candidatus Accumulibacter phosphatis TaxID=327160 RepID=UPI001A36B325|nr:hypothetical protein [Candidatus Accumulibacter phosphatis]